MRSATQDRLVTSSARLHIYRFVIASLPSALPVLVVDDERDVRELVAFILRREGCEVVLAEDGIAALEKLAAGFPPLIIVLDLEMPRMDGDDFLRALARRPLPLPRVIVFTAHPFRRPSTVAMCIQKPCSAGQLVAAVSQVLAAA